MRLLLLFWALRGLQAQECDGDYCDMDDSMLLSVPRQAFTEITRKTSRVHRAGEEPFTLAGKSIYFLVIDRFARAGEQAKNTSYCKLQADWTPEQYRGGGYCGGKIKGITSKLDYIQGMGFDCIWITPPVESNSFMGYDATNLNEVNKEFGSKEDLKELSNELHKRGMCLVVDIVLNHMTPLMKNGKLRVSDVVPFDKEEYYHQRDRKADQSFEDYVKNPVQASKNMQKDNHQLHRMVKKKKVTCGPSTLDQTGCECMPGNMGEGCPLFDASLLVEGWMGGLGDLNHSHPFVRQELLNYVVDLVQDYGVDALRLDTAVYVDPKFVRAVQQASGVEILGEATVNNCSYQSRLMRDEKNERILTGLLNFPPFYQVSVAFCGFYMVGEFGDYSRQGTWAEHANMKGLGKVMENQLLSDMYESLDLMGTFADNHDENARVNYYCKNDEMRIKNALAWVMLSRGVPIIYYGTEQGLQGHQPKTGGIGQDEMRESIWQTEFKTDTWQYEFIKQLHKVRKGHQIGSGISEVKGVDENILIFTRACDGGLRDCWVFLNNLEDSKRNIPLRYCPGPLPGINTQAWYDAISGRRMDQYLEEGCFTSPDGEPKALVLRMDEILVM